MSGHQAGGSDVIRGGVEAGSLKPARPTWQFCRIPFKPVSPERRCVGWPSDWPLGGSWTSRNIGSLSRHLGDIKRAEHPKRCVGSNTALKVVILNLSR